MSAENNLVKAIYSFKGKNNDELCFKKGDIITVTQREEGGWWEGTLGDTTGWFPSNYVTEYKDPSGSSTTSPVRAPSEIQAFRNVVLKDIIDSEKAHVAEMQGLITNFLQPLESSDILTRDEFKQLTGNINEVLQTHEQFLILLEECAAKTGSEQRVGGLFLQWAPRIKAVHQIYCAGHPKAVCILDKYKEELGAWMEGAGAVCPGTLVLTAGLSKPFRRLGKYPAMLQELARHVHEAHPDRGDTHRASAVYKDIASGCAALRRQKELELQVVTGEVRGWPGGELAALGDVLHMGSVAVGPAHQDRYLVLFPSALLLLSVSKRVSAFVYEGCLPLTGITVCKLDDTETRKNAFEISGPMIDTIVAVCQTKAEADNWVGLLQKHSNTSSPAHEPGQPQSLPHLARSPSEGALSSINSSRRSLYHVTLPPPHYPSASPYYSLTKYFARLVKKKVITRQMLRKLLHERTWAKAFELTGLPVKRRHKNRIHLKIDEDGVIETETECSESERNSDESDRETDTTTESCTSSSCTDTDFYGIRILRQNALDHASLHPSTSTTSSCSSNYGYVRYFNNSTDFNVDKSSSGIKGDYTQEIFPSTSYANINEDAEIAKEIRAQFDRIVREQGNRLHPGVVMDRSDSNENSSFEFIQPKPYMACEDLVNMDQNTLMNVMGGTDDDFELTRRSFPEYAGCSKNEPPLKLWKSIEEAYPPNTSYNETQTVPEDCAITSDIVKVLEPPDIQETSILSDPTHLILDPPPMFRNDEDNVKIISMNPNVTPFRKHSINSDKKIRRSVTKSLVEYAKSDDDNYTRSDKMPINRMSSQSETHQTIKICECCRRSVCHSPRSSDSGVVGSCTLASPDLNIDYNNSNNEADNRKKSLTSDELKLSLSDITEGNYMAQRKKLTLSEAEAAKFEEQCRCTSPFSSTPRTSCENSTTSDNVVVGILDSKLTSVTYSPAVLVPSSKALSKIQRTSIRANINQHLLLEKTKPEPPPRIYRKPSTHIEEPKNVRKNVMKQEWTTLNICERTKPSLHYHMRIYREEPDGDKCERQTRKDSVRNCDGLKKNNDLFQDSRSKKTRSRSVDLSKLHEASKESQTGFVVYRSDLYAHWWMKAKLPITVVSDSGKDHCIMPTTAEGNSVGSPSSLTNHKRSHSFNNHQSYSQHTQQAQHTPQSKQKNQSARWLLNSCDSLAQAAVRPNNNSLGKFSSLDFIDTTGTTYNTKGWSITCLRPAPPLRPQSFTVGSDENIGPTHPYAPHQRKSNSYEEDALILRVIEAYCTSAKCRNAVSSECDDDNPLSIEALVRSPSLPIHSTSNHGAPSLWSVVMRLQNEIKTLKMDMKHLQLQLNDEKQERCLAIAALQTQHFLKDAKESKC